MKLTPETVVVVSKNERAEREAFQASIRQLTLAGSYDKLEEQAEEYRQKKSRFSNSYLKLWCLYTAFGNFSADEPDSEWQALITAVEKWKEKMPDSATAKLALAETYRGYAWKARTTETADQVTEDRWKVMGARLRKAMEASLAAKSAPKPCPAWYGITQRIALGAQMPRAQYDALFAEGMKNAGFYDPIYAYRAYFLFPRWYGARGEWEQTAMESMKRTDIPDAKEIYAKCALYLSDMEYLMQEYTRTDASWAALKESFTALEAHYPDSLEIQSVFLRVATSSYDPVEARKQFKLVGNRFDPACWESKEQFLGVTGWLSLPDSEFERAKADYRRRHP